MKLGKWQQMVLLRQHKLTAAHIPTTALYTKEAFQHYLNNYTHIYVKRDVGGQGRGMFKVTYGANHALDFDGYSVQGVRMNGFVETVDEFHAMLHPLEKFGKLSAVFIIQEGISSNTKNGQPVSFRVHVQKLHGKWLIGGINGKIATGIGESGIANVHRGAEIYPLNDLLQKHLQLNTLQRIIITRRMKKIAKRAAKVIEDAAPAREYGIDFGLTPANKPIIFEVNTTPGIGGFATIEKGAQWKRIVAIRKLQRGK